MQSTYPEGPPFTLTALFKDDNGNLIDYPTVQFSSKIMRLGNMINFVTYSGLPFAYNVIQKISTGYYSIELLSLGMAGNWPIGWRGLDSSGTIMAKGEAVITVAADTSGLF